MKIASLLLLSLMIFSSCEKEIPEPTTTTHGRGGEDAYELSFYRSITWSGPITVTVNGSFIGTINQSRSLAPIECSDKTGCVVYTGVPGETVSYYCTSGSYYWEGTETLTYPCRILGLGQ
ncbi:MAG: hypothetical protein ACOYLH_03690 [Flavobacteriales bacterium]|jgi:hypothetical protein